MESLQETFSLNLWPLFIIAIGGVLFFFVLRIAKRLLVVNTQNMVWVNRLAEKWPLTERIFWALFAVVCLGALLKAGVVTGAIIALVVITTSWTFIKNYIAGILVLAGGDLKIGQSLRFNSYEGKVVSLNAMSCDIELDDTGKETLKVPYTRLTSQLLIKTSPSENVVTHIFVLEPANTCNPVELEGQIEDKLVNMPWLIAQGGFTIERLENTESRFRFRIVLQGIDKKQLKRGAEELRGLWG
jgi:hypothetical protein